MPSTSSLDPEFRPLAEHLLSVARDFGFNVLVASTRRSYADQRRLYLDWKAGRSPLPALPPGTSLHELGLAMDVNVVGEKALNPDGSPNWKLALMGSWWKSWGHPWGPKDPVHFQPSWARSRVPVEAPKARRKARRRGPVRRRRPRARRR